LIKVNAYINLSYSSLIEQHTSTC